MPFKVLETGTTIPKKISERRSYRDKDKILEKNVSIVYYEGDIIPDEDVAPSYQQRYEDGDEYVRARVKKVTKAQANKSK